MSDRIFLRLGENGALGADDLQWILYRSRRTMPPGMDTPLIQRDWVGVSFVRSTRARLEACISEKGIQPTAEGQAALDALPATFDAWKRSVDKLVEYGNKLK
jgi:hypothetical protein